MKDLSHILLLSDLDGTLLNDDACIPERNKQAIERFVEQGGFFAIATGRGYSAAVRYARQLPVNAPSINFNGGNLYDYAADKELWAAYLPETARGYVQAVLKKFPHISAGVLIGNDYYEITPPKEIRAFGVDGVSPIHKGIDELDGPWYKVLFQVPDEEQAAIEAYANSLGATDIRFTTSTSYYLELLCSEVSKGNALKRMPSFFDLTGKTVVAIGDYHNDLEMLQEANFSAAPASAEPEIKEMVDLVVCDNNEGAVASLIEYIEANMSK